MYKIIIAKHCVNILSSMGSNSKSSFNYSMAVKGMDCNSQVIVRILWNRSTSFGIRLYPQQSAKFIICQFLKKNSLKND